MYTSALKLEAEYSSETLHPLVALMASRSDRQQHERSAPGNFEKLYMPPCV
jgi:hypothetical protein